MRFDRYNYFSNSFKNMIIFSANAPYQKPLLEEELKKGGCCVPNPIDLVSTFKREERADFLVLCEVANRAYFTKNGSLGGYNLQVFPGHK